MSFFGGAAAPARLGPAMESVRSLPRSVLALGLSVLVFLPLFPAMPASGLDPSWRMALNEAWSRGLDFARDMVFTYGPYSFLSTDQYHPDTYPVLVVCSLFLGAVLFLLLRHIELGSKGRLHVFFILLCLVASDYTQSPDVRFLCYPFLFLIAASTPQNEASDGGRAPLLSTPVILNLASFSLGLICLVKATYAVEIGAMGVLSMIALYATGRRFLATAVLVSFVFGLTVFWLIAGQPIAELPRFFLNQAQVAAGYGWAMASDSRLLPPALFLLSTVPLALAIKRDLRPPTVCRYMVAVGMAVILFLSFKEAFVREDDWHVMTATEMLLVLPWCWPSDRASFWRNVQAAMACTTVLVSVLIFPQTLDLQDKTADLEQLLHCSDQGPLVCPTRLGWLQRTYHLSLARIRTHVRLPRIHGTVDVYTMRQSLAIANGLRWDPRPVGQSYSAYTPTLARMNVEHLLGSRAPDGVLFALEPIDSRLPTLGDGPSWPVLLTRYSVNWLGSVATQPSGEVPIAYLKHKPDAGRITVVRTPLLARTAEFGQKIDLPPSGDVLFAKIHARPNVLGRFAEVLFKVPPLYINFLFPAGRVERYKLIPGMARAGFIISPVVTNAFQFSGLQDLKVNRALSARRPVAFWLSGFRGARLVWASATTIRISSLREEQHR